MRRVNRKDKMRINGIKSRVISENSLNKILVLGIKDKVFLFFSEALRKSFHSWFTRPKFLFKLLKLMVNFRRVIIFVPVVIIFCGG